MKHKLAGFLIILFASIHLCAQEHGFLPGQDFTFYSAVHKYDLKGASYYIKVDDDRSILQLQKITCSKKKLTNTSEFEGQYGLETFSKYAAALFSQANAVVTVEAKDTVQITLEALDSRLIGFLFIRAHGLCQIRVKYKSLEKTYCVDITDADEHSPVSSDAWVTRLTATRIMTAAAMREIIEYVLADLQNLQ